MYYNTTNQTGEELKRSTGRALSQTEQILHLFIENPGKLFTPADVHKEMGESFLLTSVRRSMSDLTKSDDLVKTHEQGKGKFGAANYKWVLSRKKHSLAYQLSIFES